MSTGRNIDEIKRIILSLQKHDADNVSTPADWNPDDDVVLPAPLTLETARDRLADSDEALKKYSWYLTMRKDS
jgi:peroxiredoxin (alkyl hydroperoxide reductase subunit C)